MDLQQPNWFAQCVASWDRTVGEEVTRRVQPVGVTPEGRLVVLCADLPWSLNMRLLAAALTVRLNQNRPQEIPEVTGIVVLKPAPLPADLLQCWPEILGKDLAEQVTPQHLSDWGRELVTEAQSAEARDVLARRAPVALARLRAILPHNTIRRFSQSRLRPVSVLVASSGAFSDRQALDDVLMDTWHDAVQTVGPEHLLWVVHAGRTPADRMVQEWANSTHSSPGLASLLVEADALGTDADEDSAQATLQRNERLVARDFDLCLVFAADHDEVIPLADLAHDRGIAVRRYVPELAQ